MRFFYSNRLKRYASKPGGLVLVAAMLMFVSSLPRAQNATNEATRLATQIQTMYQKDSVEAAERSLKRALAIQESLRGREHPAVSSRLIDLAQFYRTQARYAEAEPLYKRALAIYEKSLGPDHPDVATSLIGLALLYYSQSRYAEASYGQKLVTA